MCTITLSLRVYFFHLVSANNLLQANMQVMFLPRFWVWSKYLDSLISVLCDLNKKNLNEFPQHKPFVKSPNLGEIVCD